MCQDLVANLDRVLHGAGGYHKGLNHKGADQEGGHERDRDDRDPLKSALNAECCDGTILTPRSANTKRPESPARMRAPGA